MKNLLLTFLLFVSTFVFGQKEFTESYNQLVYATTSETNPKTFNVPSTVVFNINNTFHIKVLFNNREHLLEIRSISKKDVDDSGEPYKYLVVQDVTSGDIGNLVFFERTRNCMLVFKDYVIGFKK